jgi:multidrug efflux pump subunit AcrA (membrane-fusion protein)
MKLKLNMKKILLYSIPIAILVLGYFIMSFLTTFQTETPRRKPEPVKKLVEAEIIKLGDVPTKISAFGKLSSAQPLTIFSEVQGTLLKGDIPFQPARSFRKGDLLFKIDDREVILEINSLKSDLLNALASVLPEIKLDFPEEYPKWQSYFNKSEFETPLDSLPEASNQKIKLFLSRFNVYKLYFSIRNLEIQHAKHYYYAPFNGSISTVSYRVGSKVMNGSLLGEIINLDDLEVEVPVPAGDIQWIDYTKPVTFTSSDITGTWTGKIKRIGNTIDEQTQSVQVFISIDKSKEDRIYNGIFLNAAIPGKAIKNSYEIPRSAVYNSDYIYLIKDGKLDYRRIDIARREINSVIVNGAISDGDTLVTEVLQGVAPGMLAVANLRGNNL